MDISILFRELGRYSRQEGVRDPSGQSNIFVNIKCEVQVSFGRSLWTSLLPTLGAQMCPMDYTSNTKFALHPEIEHSSSFRSKQHHNR